ncbi:MAG: FecR domain-containing protein [Deltaproteobacteria bacterium]|nr:FecR domain-containing protein [Deltaproteobacteria bacterium]
MSADDYLWEKSGAPDPEVARLEALLSPLAHEAPLRQPRRRWPYVAAIVAAAAAVTFALWPREPSCDGRSGYAFSGDATCNGRAASAGTLPVGGHLETAAGSATLTIAQIGTADLGPHTRVRLVRSDAQHQQLSLERGSMHARVDAPPRLFAVSTPSAEVTDLGCEYRIAIDEHGAGSIDVLAGKVELATRSGGVVVAPVNTHATILPGRAPGVPVGPGASEALVAAVHEYERGVPGAFDRVLQNAQVQDAITLVAIGAIDPSRRAAVLARLAEISPPPGEVTVASATASAADFATWRDDVVDTYVGLWASPPKHP